MSIADKIAQIAKKGTQNISEETYIALRGDANPPPSDEVANGDRDEDRQLEDEEDPDDDIVDDNGFVNASKNNRELMQTQGVLDGPFVMPSFAGSIHGVPLYSDELANGDSADDRDIHNEDDMNDDVVDYNGGTSRGYGAIEPQRRFVENNHILSGSHNNGPRYTGDSWSSSLANPLAKGGNLIQLMGMTAI